MSDRAPRSRPRPAARPAFRRALMVVVPALLAACTPQPEIGFSPIPDSFRDRVGPETLSEVVASQLRRHRLDGVVVAVVVDDSVTFLRAFGRVPGSDAPLPDTARFQTAAAMPVVNALAAAQLAHAGPLELDAPVARWAPRLPGPHDQATVAGLLTHTAGLVARPAMAGQTGADSLGEQVHYLHRRDRLTEPGAICSRAPAGVALAAYAMQKAAGRPYPEVLEATVFEPLGMDRTTARHPGDALLLRRRRPEESTPTPAAMAPRYEPVPPESALAAPSRALYSTVPDLAVLVRALFSGLEPEPAGSPSAAGGIPPPVVASALRPRTATPSGDSVALGVVWDRWEGRRLLEIVDHAPGHRSLVSLLPDQRVGVIVASTGTLGDLDRLPDWVFRRLLGLPGRDWPPPERALPEPAAPPLHPLDATGEYWNGGERVVLAAPDGTALKLGSGDWVLDVEWRRDAWHAVLPDGRSALRFQLVRGGDGRLYMWFEGRALVRDDGR